jgi:hypothetical protein
MILKVYFVGLIENEFIRWYYDYRKIYAVEYCLAPLKNWAPLFEYQSKHSCMFAFFRVEFFFEFRHLVGGRSQAQVFKEFGASKCVPSRIKQQDLILIIWINSM